MANGHEVLSMNSSSIAMTDYSEAARGGACVTRKPEDLGRAWDRRRYHHAARYWPGAGPAMTAQAGSEQSPPYRMPAVVRRRCTDCSGRTRVPEARVGRGLVPVRKVRMFRCDR